MQQNQSKQLLKFTDKGIWCEQADVYIDPWKKVSRALITHGHSDHARYGHASYLCSESAAPAIKYRLGNIDVQTIRFSTPLTINGVKFSFHPAGHILGSAQIRVEYKGEVWVASGDYKLEHDGLAEGFEPIQCHTFITESTFGLPVYDWRSQDTIFAQINAWWKSNAEEGKASVITGYSLGKAQRILQGLDRSIGKIYCHGAVENINKVFRKQGIDLPSTIQSTPDIMKKEYGGNIVVTPPSGIGGNWMKRFGPVSIAICSGWMALRGARRRQGVDRGFVLSDHVDWKDLNQAVKETNAERVFVTHGYSEVYSRYLREQGINAHVANTEYTGETIDRISQQNEAVE